jgi:hypothetical protein
MVILRVAPQEQSQRRRDSLFMSTDSSIYELYPVLVLQHPRPKVARLDIPSRAPRSADKVLLAWVNHITLSFRLALFAGEVEVNKRTAQLPTCPLCFQFCPTATSYPSSALLLL